mgnify:CR=1 FL=1
MAVMQKERVMPLSKLLQAGLIGGAIGAIGSFVVYFIGKAMGIPFEIMPPGATELDALPVVMIAVANVVPGLIAGGVLALLARFVAQPVRIFQIISLIFLIVSFASPFTQPAEVTMGTKLALNLMHIVAAGGIVWSLTMRES